MFCFKQISCLIINSSKRSLHLVQVCQNFSTKPIARNTNSILPSKLIKSKFYQTCATLRINQKLKTALPVSTHDSISSIQIKKRPARKKKVLEEEKPGIFNVVAYATAEEYDLVKLVEGLKRQDLYEPRTIENDNDVVHAVAKYRIGKEPREIFFFKEGSVVLWNITDLESSNVLTFLRQFEQDSYSERLVQTESEIMSYRYHMSPDVNTCLEKDGDFVLAVEKNLSLDKYTLSNAMVLSVKLGIWESSLEKYIDEIEFVTEDLKRYLLDVYRKVMQEENEENNRVRREIASDITGEEYNQIEESDMIVTFEGFEGQSSTLRHRWGKQLWFNISKAPLVEDIIGSELRIFKNTTVVMSERYPYTKITIHIWQITKTDRSEILKPITSVNTTAAYSGWIEFNMTSCLRSWMTSVNSNHGIYLTVTPLQKPGKDVRLEDVGVVVTKEKEEIKPFMVAFMRATVQVNPRRKRETKTKSGPLNFMDFMKESARSSETSGSWRDCRLHNLYISFKDLKWQDWIIAPDGYSAYYCAGTCNFPLHGQLNATNHAIVQTLVHLISPKRYPKPCCAPSTMKPISVLYFLDDANVILKKYKNMMVKTCGCH